MQSFNESLFYILHGLSGQHTLIDWIIIAFAEYLPWLVAFFVLYSAHQAWRNHKRYDVFSYALAILSAGLAKGTADIIRLYIDSPRPSFALDVEPLFSMTTHSLPSGHASFFFALAMGMYFINKKYSIALFVCAAVICVARVAAGVHWPLDILAGAALGTVIAWFVCRRW